MLTLQSLIRCSIIDERGVSVFGLLRCAILGRGGRVLGLDFREKHKNDRRDGQSSENDQES